MKIILDRANQIETVEFEHGNGTRVYKYYTKKQIHDPKIQDIILRARMLWNYLIADYKDTNGDDTTLLATFKIQIYTLWPRERYARERTIASNGGHPAYMTVKEVVKFLNDNGIEASYHQY